MVGRVPTTIAYLRANELTSAESGIQHYFVVKVGPDGMSVKYKRYSKLNAQPKLVAALRRLDGEEYHAAVALVVKVLRLTAPSIGRMAQYAERGTFTSAPHIVS